MKGAVLKSLMRLFAIVSQVHSIDETDKAKFIVEKYLSLIIRKDKIRQFLMMYEFYHNSLREREIKTGRKQLSLFSVKAVIICEQVNHELNRRQKAIIISHLIEILAIKSQIKPEDTDFVKTIAQGFKLRETSFSDCLAFNLGNFNEVFQKSSIVIVDNTISQRDIRHIYKHFLTGSIVFQYVEEADVCFFRHIGNDDQLYYNDQKVALDTTYIFYEGGVIKNPLIGSIFYNDVLKLLSHDEKPHRVVFAAEKLSYKFPGSENGIKPFTFSAESGQFIGIMGNSGVGKSTLMNLLLGNLKPNTGRIVINGHSIFEENKNMEGVVGYVPQDEMLIEELTVFQNLYYSARLCFRGINKVSLFKKVCKLLMRIGLQEVKNLKVGSPLNKFISGGQRKRLNIALEIIREPNILFVDEPTSGLSSSDSDMVIDLLKKQSLKGKLVFANIHQPSSDVFKKFNKLILLDEGGRVIYYGNPIDSLVYLKTYMQQLNADEGECTNCGNINPEQVLKIIETRKVNAFGDYISEREVLPEEWYQNFQKDTEPELGPAENIKIDLPNTEFKPESSFKQFGIFTLRNLLSKLSDKQYLAINLLEAPVLAIILGWFTRHNAGTPDNPQAYIFSSNSSLPVFIFMSVVVAIFLGLMISAEEVIKDRKILKREKFLHLNRISYYNSKVLFIGLILAFQMFLFVLIGNTILEIKGMFLHYWFMLWSVAMVAGVFGLNISATMNSVVSIYILIPLLIVPQILLGGAMIPFNKLNSKLTNPVYVPFAGNIVPSRWAYEGLVVYQFKHNKYRRGLFDLEQKVSRASYIQNYFIPEVERTVADIKKATLGSSMSDQIEQKRNKLQSVVNQLSEISKEYQMEFGVKDFDNLNITLFNEIEGMIKVAKKYYSKVLDNAITERDEKIYEFEGQVGGLKELLKLKEGHSNEKLEELVTNKGEIRKLVFIKNHISQTGDPIYHYPKNNFFKSHFYAPAKKIGNMHINTYWFNLLVLYFFLSLLYLILIFEILPKIWGISYKKKSIIHFFKTLWSNGNLKPLEN